MGTIVVWVSLGIVVLVIASLVPIWRSYRHLVVGNRVAVAEGSMLLKTASCPIEYATAGHGFPVLISHGGAGGYDQGLMTARLYIGEGLMAVAPSCFGHLRTPLASDSSATAQADAYAQLLDELGINRAAILGVSGGGPSVSADRMRIGRCLNIQPSQTCLSKITEKPLSIYPICVIPNKT